MITPALVVLFVVCVAAFGALFAAVVSHSRAQPGRVSRLMAGTTFLIAGFVLAAGIAIGSLTTALHCRMVLNGGIGFVEKAAVGNAILSAAIVFWVSGAAGILILVIGCGLSANGARRFRRPKC